MSLKVLQHELGLDIEPPESFDHTIYRKLYLQNQRYFDEGTEQIDPKYIMYHHYLNYGKSFGHACNHNIIVYYHIPKCGGTSIHYGTILPNLYRQYHNDKYYIYNIDWTNKGTKLLTTISYAEESEVFDLLCATPVKDSHNKYLKHISVDINTKHDFLFNKSNLLCLIINAAGFKDKDLYIEKFIGSKKKYDQYLLLRDPVDLQMSIFYYLRDIGTWEKTYGKFNKKMSFRDYINHSNKYVNNWLIRQFSQLSDNDIVTGIDYAICKRELQTFTKIGFIELFDKFINYLHREYNWDNSNSSASIKLNKNSVSNKQSLSLSDQKLLNNLVYYEQQIYDYFFTNRTIDV